MASIQTSVKELQDISAEIQRLNKRIKELRNRKKEVEKDIRDYLDEKDQPGVKYQNYAIILSSKKGRDRISEKEKRTRGTELLNSHGINNSEKVLDVLLEAIRGPPVNKTCIKIQKIKE